MLTCYLCFQIEMYFSEDSATTSENADTDAEFALTNVQNLYFPIKK